jgi:hypothetical protein
MLSEHALCSLEEIMKRRVSVTIARSSRLGEAQP